MKTVTLYQWAQHCNRKPEVVHPQDVDQYGPDDLIEYTDTPIGLVCQAMIEINDAGSRPNDIRRIKDARYRIIDVVDDMPSRGDHDLEPADLWPRVILTLDVKGASIDDIIGAAVEFAADLEMQKEIFIAVAQFYRRRFTVGEIVESWLNADAVERNVVDIAELVDLTCAK